MLCVRIYTVSAKALHIQRDFYIEAEFITGIFNFVGKKGLADRLSHLFLILSLSFCLCILYVYAVSISKWVKDLNLYM